MHQVKFLISARPPGRAFEHGSTFPISGQVVKKTPLRFLISRVLTNFDEIWHHV